MLQDMSAALLQLGAAWGCWQGRVVLAHKISIVVLAMLRSNLVRGGCVCTEALCLCLHAHLGLRCPVTLSRQILPA